MLITGVDWTDGDLVKEKIEFICRKIEVSRVQQNDDGTVVNKNAKPVAKWIGNGAAHTKLFCGVPSRFMRTAPDHSASSRPSCKNCGATTCRRLCTESARS